MKTRKARKGEEKEDTLAYRKATPANRSPASASHATNCQTACPTFITSVPLTWTEEPCTPVPVAWREEEEERESASVVALAAGCRVSSVVLISCAVSDRRVSSSMRGEGEEGAAWGSVCVCVCVFVWQIREGREECKECLVTVWEGRALIHLQMKCMHVHMCVSLIITYLGRRRRPWGALPGSALARYGGAGGPRPVCMDQMVGGNGG